MSVLSKWQEKKEERREKALQEAQLYDLYLKQRRKEEILLWKYKRAGLLGRKRFKDWKEKQLKLAEDRKSYEADEKEIKKINKMIVKKQIEELEKWIKKWKEEGRFWAKKERKEEEKLEKENKQEEKKFLKEQKREENKIMKDFAKEEAKDLKFIKRTF